MKVITKVNLNNDTYTLDEIVNIINEEQKSFYLEKDSTVPIYSSMNEYLIYIMYYISITLVFILILTIISFMYDIIERNSCIAYYCL